MTKHPCYVCFKKIDKRSKYVALDTDSDKRDICAKCVETENIELFAQDEKYIFYHEAALVFSCPVSVSGDDIESFKKALNYIEKALGVKKTADGYSTKASILDNLGHLDEAEKSYRLALNLDPHHESANNNLAVLLEEKRKGK